MTTSARTIVTAPTVEPISLTEAKTHLRLESSTFAASMSETQSIAPGAHAVAASYSLVGTGVDVLGSQALVILNSGTNGSSGTVDCKIQESDDDSTYTDWTGGAFTQVTEANDNAIQEKEYTGTKQYIRTVATVATATCDFGTTVIERTATHSEDTYVENLIVVAREWAEGETWRALINQTWDFYWSDWPTTNYIRVPMPPLSSVTGVYYSDTDGDETEFSSDYYITDTDSEPGRVVLGYGYEWPTTTLYPSNPIRIRAVCGYGATSASVPERIRQAMLIYLATLYEQRDQIVVGQTPIEMPRNFRAESLLWGERCWL